MSADVKLDTRVLDAIAAKLDTNRDKVVRSCAFQVHAEAGANIVKKDIWEFGALFNSLEVVPKKPGVYWVQDGVTYGIYHEFGTWKMAARPWMVPAVETVRRRLVELYKELFP